jgi:hypothetical protein
MGEPGYPLLLVVEKESAPAVSRTLNMFVDQRLDDAKARFYTPRSR